ncbi:hypothetical protein J5J10_15120 [Ciceribacter sp. L1K23]|uniref:hypothetical protein n=1 Tax=unclassified Ciceribacter TaxID=2628820 RepID=UPI001ABEB355|nr:MULTISPECIES: hypothetical protein [unclassified Ciceribacter]MBO3758382.1 hypothetical protein [Ciceribacter sp. L1K22]MBR0557018.1 hypothetical protein [Ciceribacter sp. L1K23]
MKKSPYTDEREKIVARAISPVASELRLLDAADLIALLRFEFYSSLSDLVASAAELYFHPGTVIFGAGGEYRLDWGEMPEVSLDLEIRPKDVTIYAKLSLGDRQAGLEINHIAFEKPSADPHENTAFLAQALEESRFIKQHGSPVHG